MEQQLGPVTSIDKNVEQEEENKKKALLAQTQGQGGRFNQQNPPTSDFEGLSVLTCIHTYPHARYITYARVHTFFFLIFFAKVPTPWYAMKEAAASPSPVPVADAKQKYIYA